MWPPSGASPGGAAGEEAEAEAEAGALEGLLPLQVLSLPGRGALSLEADPGGKFVFAADTGEGLLYALHLHLSEGGGGGKKKGYVCVLYACHVHELFTTLS